MTMILDARGAIGMLRLVVFEKGADFVYEPTGDEDIRTCVNFNGGQPSCIVGHVLANLGINSETAIDLGIAGNMPVRGVAQRLGVHGYEWQLDEDAVTILAAAQCSQDDGQSWGEALEDAEEVFRYC